MSSNTIDRSVCAPHPHHNYSHTGADGFLVLVPIFAAYCFARALRDLFLVCVEVSIYHYPDVVRTENIL